MSLFSKPRCSECDRPIRNPHKGRRASYICLPCSDRLDGVVRCWYCEKAVKEDEVNRIMQFDFCPECWPMWSDLADGVVGVSDQDFEAYRNKILEQM